MKMTSPAVMVFFFESAIPKVFGYSHTENSLATITRHLDNSIWNTLYDWKFYGHGCQVYAKTLLYASLSLKQV